MIALVAIAASPAHGEDRARVEYIVDLAEARSQMIGMTMRLRDVDSPAIDVMLPTWRPGRYVILDPASTVQDVVAEAGESGEALPIRKTDKSTWRIDDTRGAKRIDIRWRVYANSIADRTRHADDTHAFISPSSVFFYDPQRRSDAINVYVVNGSPDWRIATGLDPLGDDAFVLAADNYDVLVDSPLEIGVHDRLAFEVEGKVHEIAIWGGAHYDAARMKSDFASIVTAETAIFGDMPYERFVFLIHVGSDGGGGTEHLNSTIMQTTRRALEDDEAYKRFLALVSHEMFHTWNVKQLRPACIHPYDYQHENYCDLFWVAEGTTSYYDDLVLLRCGLMSEKDYLAALRVQVRAYLDRPGRGVQSLAEASFDAWIKHYKATPHSGNSTVNFYSQGALTSFVLDMLIRRESGDSKSLDDVMRLMYERFPLRGPGYTTDDLIAACGETAGADLRWFFDQYVVGTAALDVDAALDVVGLRLRFEPTDRDRDEDEAEEEVENDDDDDVDNDNGDDEGDDDDGDVEEKSDSAAGRERASLGASLVERDGRAVVRSARSDGAAFAGGLIADDEIIALNGRRLNPAELDVRLKQFAPGDVVQVTFMRRDLLRTIDITLGGEPDGTWKIERVKQPTDAQQATFESWSGRPWKRQRDADGAADAAAGNGQKADEAQGAPVVVPDEPRR